MSQNLLRLILACSCAGAMAMSSAAPQDDAQAPSFVDTTLRVNPTESFFDQVIEKRQLDLSWTSVESTVSTTLKITTKTGLNLDWLLEPTTAAPLEATTTSKPKYFWQESDTPLTLPPVATETSTMGLGKVITSIKNNMSSHHDGIAVAPAAPAVEPRKPPTKRQIFHSRYNHGPNLGGLFVAEKWISDEVFGKSAKNTSELDAVSSLVSENGIDKAREIYDRHYNTWITENDIKWMKEQGVTAIRMPVAFWMVAGGQFTKGTPFEPYAAVYKNAWAVAHNLIQIADKYGIGILVDMHALPGGANKEDHSGTSRGVAELWESTYYKQLSLDLLGYVASDMLQYDNVVGIAILNEAPFGADGTKEKEFYAKAINRIRGKNADVPLVISDGWNLDMYVDWVRDKENANNGESIGVIIDSHYYRCFSPEHRNASADFLVQNVTNSFNEQDQADVMVGEWSLAIDGQSWDKYHGNKDEMKKQYGTMQTNVFYQHARAGLYFWTFKFEHGSGGDWDFQTVVKAGQLPNLRTDNWPQKSPEYYDAQRKQRGHDSFAQHQSYWIGVDPKKDWQFWRYQQGFSYGYTDAQSFDAMAHSELGRVNAWRKTRLLQHIDETGPSDLAWQFEHGFKAGLEAFKAARAAPES